MTYVRQQLVEVGADQTRIFGMMNTSDVCYEVFAEQNFADKNPVSGFYGVPCAQAKEFYEKAFAKDDLQLTPKDLLFEMIGKIFTDGTGLDLQVERSMAFILSLPRLPYDSHGFLGWLADNLQSMGEKMGLRVHMFAIMYAENWGGRLRAPSRSSGTASCSATPT